MRQRRMITLLLYVLFVVLILSAFILSAFLTKDKAGEQIVKEDFLVLKEDKEISAVYYDGEYMWVGGIDGITIYDAQTREELGYISDFKLVYSAEMVQTPDDIIWIGHEDGLTGIRKDDWSSRIHFGYPDIPKGRVNTVEWDGERLWLGTYNGGASLIQKDNDWKVEALFDKESGLCSDSVNVICNTEEELWLASYLDTKSGGISILKDGSFQYLTVEDGLPHSYITSMQYLGDNKMLAGTGYMDTGGMALIEQTDNRYQVTETFYMADGVPGEKVRQLYLDTNNYLWITTEYDGIIVVNYGRDGLTRPLKGVCYREENGLSDNEIKCITETPRDYWLGGKYGLTVISRTFMEKKLE